MLKIEKKNSIRLIVIGILIILLLISNFFYKQLSKFLMLYPDYTFKNITEIHFIDVGQGDAIAIKFSNEKIMLIDSGTSLYESKLLNYLDNLLVGSDKTIDYLVLTHLDSDHSGNILKIINSYKIGEFYRPQINASIETNPSENTTKEWDKIVKTLLDKDVKMIENKVGVTIYESGCTLEWFSPLDDIVSDDNDYCPVIKLKYGKHSALFTGDISEKTEKELINAFGTSFLDIDILKVAHHGSKYSTSLEFLETTTPSFACISVGENTYGHPANELISRILEYDNLHSTHLYDNTFTTIDNGNIIFTLDDTISINFIKNIDDYNFVNYYIYSSVAILILVIFAVLPYYKTIITKIKFKIRNKNFEKQQKN